MTRHKLTVLMGLCFFLSSGSKPTAAEIPEDRGIAYQTKQDLTPVLQKVNPELSYPELIRINKAILRCETIHRLNPTLVTAIMSVESGVRPWVRSEQGAVGLMQVMPYMGLRFNFSGNLATIEVNVEVGCRILASNIAAYGLKRGVSAYFWGNEIKNDDYYHKVSLTEDRLKEEF